MKDHCNFPYRAVTALAVLALLAGFCGGALGNPASSPQTSEEAKKIEEAMPERASVQPEKPRKLLVFYLCQGFAHDSIPLCNKALEVMGKKTGAFLPVFSNDMSAFEPPHLDSFDGVLFNNTTRLKFENPQHRQALMDFVKRGKGVIGIHAATDNFYDWPEAAEMMGGLFDGHPWGAGGTWAVKIDEPDHPINKGFQGKGFLIRDEIYQISGPYSREKLRVLLSLDMTNSRNHKVGGIKREDNDFAIAWIREFEKGRVFYCSLGHNHEIFWNETVLRHYLDGIQYALGDLKADATPSAKLKTKPRPAHTSNPGDLEDCYSAIRRYEFGQSREFLSKLEEGIRSATPEELAEIEASLLEILKSRITTFAGKQFVCRMLRRAGSGRSIPALAELLYDEKFSDEARFALQGFASADVDRALCIALDTLRGDSRIGLIGSIGQRGCRKAVPQLAELICSEDAVLAGAAISALGRIRGEEAANVLARSVVLPELKVLRDDAYLQCADSMAAEGSSGEAAAIYRELSRKGNPAMIRIAAFRGTIRLEGERAIPSIREMLTDEDPRVRQSAGVFIAEMPPGAALTQALAGQIPTLAPSAQNIMLAALAVRGDKAAAPAASQAAESTDEALRLTAIRALGVLGGAPHVELLARICASGGSPGRAAAESLNRLTGEDVDGIILRCMQDQPGAVRAALIPVLKERRPNGAVPALLRYGSDPDAAVRRESFKALESLATPQEIPALLALLLNPRDAGDRSKVERSILAACTRLNGGEEQLKSIQVLLASLLPGADPCTRSSLLSLLGKLPGEASLEALCRAMQNEAGEVREAAFRALTDWPDARPMNALLNAAREAETERHLAFQAYMRMVELPNTRSSEENRRAYEAARDLGHRAEEKERILSSVARVTDFWVLEFLKSFLNDPASKEKAEEVFQEVTTALAKTVPHDAMNCPVTLAFPYADQYSAGGKDALTDGKWGSTNHMDGCWQGFEGSDLEATIDLGREVAVRSIRAGFLQNNNSWIFLPSSVEFSLSTDGRNFKTVTTFQNPEPASMQPALSKTFFKEVENLPARIIRVRAKNVGVCPKWHPGNGNKAWLFADEIQVNPHLEKKTN